MAGMNPRRTRDNSTVPRFYAFFLAQRRESTTLTSPFISLAMFPFQFRPRLPAQIRINRIPEQSRIRRMLSRRNRYCAPSLRINSRSPNIAVRHVDKPRERPRRRMIVHPAPQPRPYHLVRLPIPSLPKWNAKQALCLRVQLVQTLDIHLLPFARRRPNKKIQKLRRPGIQRSGVALQRRHQHLGESAQCRRLQRIEEPPLASSHRIGNQRRHGQRLRIQQPAHPRHRSRRSCHRRRRARRHRCCRRSRCLLPHRTLHRGRCRQYALHKIASTHGYLSLLRRLKAARSNCKPRPTSTCGCKRSPVPHSCALFWRKGAKPQPSTIPFTSRTHL